MSIIHTHMIQKRYAFALLAVIGGAVALLALLIVFGQFSNPSVNSYRSDGLAALAPTAAPPGYNAPAAGGILAPIADDEENQVNDSIDRVVLKNATLTLVVDGIDAKIDAITALATEFGGWVVNAQVTRAQSGDTTQVTYATITIRVESDRLDDALAQIKAGVGSVEAEAVTGQDVTQDYVDLSSQLSNLEAAEQQLQEIMSHATKTQDVLDVYTQLVNVRGDIETIRGRLRYYDESAAFSSIQITLRPTPVVQPIDVGGWQPLETARNAFQALLDLFQHAADAVITLAIIGLPLAILIGIPARVILRRRRMNRAMAQSAT